MLTVTSAARDRLTKLLSEFPQPVAARIVRRDGRLKLRRGKERPGDKAIEHDGHTMLLLGEPIAKRLNNRILDVRETTNGPKLRFRRQA
ncbi:MAG: hypothetical protein WD066_08560 [Planctomycetaceae bacterium]